MTDKNIEYRNTLFAKMQQKEKLTLDERKWLFEHPIPSLKYGKQHIVADMLPVSPGIPYVITIQCLSERGNEYPIVPTLTVPFATGGWIQLSSVVGAIQQPKVTKKSTKLSLRMISGLTAVLNGQFDSGLMMVSYQGWIPDAIPPQWDESIRNSAFSMKREIISPNMVSYSCRASDETPDVFQFLLNWYPAE